jgi:hypothetical protein
LKPGGFKLWVNFGFNLYRPTAAATAEEMKEDADIATVM